MSYDHKEFVQSDTARILREAGWEHKGGGTWGRKNQPPEETEKAKVAFASLRHGVQTIEVPKKEVNWLMALISIFTRKRRKNIDVSGR